MVLFCFFIFNENSKLCLLPHSMRKVKDEIDVDKDGIISDEELNNAIEILSKAKKKKNPIIFCLESIMKHL